MKVLRKIALVVSLGFFLIYSLYWLMFLPYFGFAIATPEGRQLWTSSAGPDGIAGPIFMWTLVLLNPVIIVIFVAKIRRRRAARPTGAPHV